ncbi:MAG: helix-turn-helix domain-containing protein [Planctomycetota bacterium]
MRRPAQIKPHLQPEEMFDWLREAQDKTSYTRRCVIWLAYKGHLRAKDIAKLLGISTQAVWLWVRQYNEYGPAGLERKGRGGRRRGFLDFQQEKEFLAQLAAEAGQSGVPKPKTIQRLVVQKLGRKVSMAYIYRLLKRHNWAQITSAAPVLQPHLQQQDSFEKYAQPWKRRR